MDAYTVLKLTVKSLDNDNTKRLKPKDTEPEISKIYVFCQKIQQGASGPGEIAAEFTYLSLRINPKS